MYFKTEQDDDGDFLRTDGVRFALQRARRVRPATGWTVFETPEECLEAWGVTYSPLTPSKEETPH